MPYETLRFIHAARALVDHPLEGTGPLPTELRVIARGATTQAFRRIVNECLEQDVDFLLLTGDSLDQSDFSIKARVELREGFEQLDDAGIQVFLVPGSLDPASLWDDFPELPGNVTVFRPERDDPVAVLRDGAVIASIRALGWRQPWFAWDDEVPLSDRTRNRRKEADETESPHDESAKCEKLIQESDDPELNSHDGESSHAESLDAHDTGSKPETHREIRRVQSAAELRPNHFAIAIVRQGVDEPGSDPQADYLAVLGGRERQTSKGGDWLLHFPGGTQGISANEPGLHGCSMVELDSDGVIRCSFLPTAPVRWEQLEVDVDEATSFEQLVRNMHAATFAQCGLPSSATEQNVDESGDTGDEPHAAPTALSEQLRAQACFFQWTIRGSGALFDSLLEQDCQAELVEWLDADAAWPLEVPRLHRFRMLASEPAVSRVSDDDEQLDVPTEFFWRVDQAQPLGSGAWSDLAQEGAEQRERLARVQSAVASCDAEIVFGLARRRGWNWFRNARS